MFTYRTHLRLRDTDATGVMYFSEQFKFALEAFEAFLKERGYSLRELMESPVLLPIVHAKGDYFAPMRVGDALEVVLKVGKVGSSSLTLHYVFNAPARSMEVGRAEIVHVAVDRLTLKKVPIPDGLRAIFQRAL